MNDAAMRRPSRSRFSLSTLLVLTALVALGTALGLARRTNHSLTQQRDALMALSSRLPMGNDNELMCVPLPVVANDFHSWHVQVPAGQDYEMRLGIGEVSLSGIPPIVGSIAIPAGRHRITLQTGDSVSEEFRYTVYLDGVQVIEKIMGSQWIPGGWSSISSISWPSTSLPVSDHSATAIKSQAIQLAGQSYTPTPNFGANDFFNGQYDSSVTRKGYRLWIDQADRAYEPTSPFMAGAVSQFDGVGLRDGLRYTPSSPATNQWVFNRPMLASMEPMLRIDPEFVASDGTILNNQSKAIKQWQIRPTATATETTNLQPEPSMTRQTRFLHGISNSGEGLQPVIELQWDAAQPDAVGLRLADTPANDSILRWRLRILSGSLHLWRELRICDRPWITPAEVLKMRSDGDSNTSAIGHQAVDLNLGDLCLSDAVHSNIDVLWQTNETFPLQIVQRRQSAYANLRLYQGLPVRMGLRLPTTLRPKLIVQVNEQQSDVPKNLIPGGPVFETIQVELEGVPRDWMWLSASAKE